VIMAEGAISLPPGAFAAAKAGTAQPVAAPKAEAKPVVEAKPTVVVRKPALREAEPEPAAAEDPKDMTPTERKIWKLKVDGEEFDFDATDEEAVKREIMKARGSNKRFETAAQLRKEAETAFEMLKDPAQLKRILSDPRVGVDVKKFAEDVVWEQIQAQQREAEWKLDPAKKTQWEREQRLAEFEEREAAAQAAGQTRQQSEAQARYETSYETKIVAALEIGGIPKTPAAVARMAEYMMKAVEQGYDLSAEEIVQQVKQDYLSDLTSVLGNADGEQLLALLGEANAEKLRKADLKRLKNPQGNPFPQRSAAKRSADAKPEPAPSRKSGSQWKDDLVKDFLNRKR